MRKNSVLTMILMALLLPVSTVMAQGEASADGGPAPASNDSWTMLRQLADASDITPGNLVSFTVSGRDEGAYLEWEASALEGVRFYQVQRSANGVEWEIVAHVRTGDASGDSKRYHSYDRNVLPGTSYYRICQVHSDGDVTDFPIVFFDGGQLEPLGYLSPAHYSGD